MKKIIALLIGLTLLVVSWGWMENRDYFNADYNDLTTEQISQFHGVSNPKKTFTSYFTHDEYTFPRNEIDEIKLLKNFPILQTLTSKKLKENINPQIVEFFNDSTNFHWGETTWSRHESQYLMKFYNNNKVVGKIYLCLEKCGMIESRPFSPSMKFGGLTKEAQSEISTIINNPENWQ